MVDIVSYREKKTHTSPTGRIVERYLDYRDLEDIKDWYHPHVVNPDSIIGRVCVFWNNAEADGYIREDPDYNQNGYYGIIKEFEYKRLNEEDKGRASFKAREYLNCVLKGE